MQIRTSQAVKTGAMLMVGASLLTSGLTVTAQAKDRHDRDRYTSKNEKKADNLKKGAIALGVVGAVLAAKGNTVPGAIAAAGGYYLYKKGRNEDRNDERYPGYYGRNDRNRNDRDRRDDRYRDGRYDGSYGYGNGYGNDRDRNYDYDRGYDYDASYNDRNDRNRNNDNCDPHDNGYRGNGRGRGNRSYDVR